MTPVHEPQHGGHHMHWGWSSPDRLELMERVVGEIKPYIEGRSVVDLGSGDGGITKILASHASTVYAVDNDSMMLGALAENCKGIPNIEPLLSKGAAIPLKDGSAGAVFASNSFHDMPRGYEAEIHRVLEPEGFAVVFDWKKAHIYNGGPPLSIRLDQETVAKRFAALGFSKVMERDYGTHYLLVLQKSGRQTNA